MSRVVMGGGAHSWQNRSPCGDSEARPLLCSSRYCNAAVGTSRTFSLRPAPSDASEQRCPARGQMWLLSHLS